MNKYQETLDFVKSLHSNDSQQETNFRVLEDIVQELIEKANKYDKKETPTKIEYGNTGIPYCSKCKHSYLRDARGNQNNYCGYCGQRLEFKG